MLVPVYPRQSTDEEAPPREPPLPAPVQKFLRAAQRRIEEFTEATRSQPFPGFVPSHYPTVYRMLESIQSNGLAPGSRFCEWGSGLGVVCGLAALLEFDAVGIEIERPLIEEAQALMADFALSAEFVEGNFLPPGAETLAVTPGEISWLATEGPDPYAALGLEISDFDVIYVYPWPDEQELIEDVFDRFAGANALLVMFDTLEGIRVSRKVRKRRR